MGVIPNFFDNDKKKYIALFRDDNFEPKWYFLEDPAS